MTKEQVDGKYKKFIQSVAANYGKNVAKQIATVDAIKSRRK